MANDLQRQTGTTREGADGSKELVVSGDRGVEVMAAAKQAAILGAMQVAKRFPRSTERVRELLLIDCERPEFAAKALYKLPPRSKDRDRENEPQKPLEGLSVRFAENSMRYMGNIDSSTEVVYEDDYDRNLMVRVTDLETNASVCTPICIKKTREKSQVWNSDQVIEEYLNKSGMRVFVVAATEASLREKENNLAARAFRNALLKFIPPDIKEECERACRATLERASRDKNTRDRLTANILEGFAAAGVKRDAVQQYVGHALTELSAEEIRHLNYILDGIRDDTMTWADALKIRDDAFLSGADIQCQSTGCDVMVKADEAALSMKIHDGHVFCMPHTPAKKKAAAPAPQPQQPQPAPATATTHTEPPQPPLRASPSAPPPPAKPTTTPATLSPNQRKLQEKLEALAPGAAEKVWERANIPGGGRDVSKLTPPHVQAMFASLERV